ncbi:hypothetical protein O0L34_g14 [Tuta absoluta]|nr:hypothetical protein O0L34_g14 [Tuta absoluta]
MCGDHPSFTKRELNAKEVKDEKGSNKTTFGTISPSSSRTAPPTVPAILPTIAARSSEHAMRLIDARRRVRSLEQVPRSDLEATTGTRALVQAALGSFRWPPYLLAVWVLVLMLTHALHCIVSVVERALPNLKRFCQYFRAWTEDSWKAEADMNHRLLPIALALVTGLMYTLYFALFVLYSIALWSIEPLCTDLEDKQSSVDVLETKADVFAVHCPVVLYSIALWSIEPLCTDLEDKQSSVDVLETKVTNYVDEITSKTNIKH